jgi:hypothetical protein
MRKVGHGRYECVLCGAVLNISDAAKVRTLIVTSTGKPDVRVIFVGGKEVHRCTLLADTSDD